MERELDFFINRELSWLDFNRRVLAMAEDPSLPLLERVRFLAIFHSNLDEFFMVRVANLLRRIELGFKSDEFGEVSNSELFSAITQSVTKLLFDVERLYFEDLMPSLESHDIKIVDYAGLDYENHSILSKIFDEHIFPILTPLMVDPSHPFPHISGLSLNFGIYVRHNGEERQFIRLKIPQNLDRFFPVKLASGFSFVRVEEIIAANLQKLFPGAELEQYFLFRVTRNQDLDIDDEDESDDLLTLMQEELEKRRFGDVVRLEVENLRDERQLRSLIEEFEIDNMQIFRVGTPLDLSSLNAIANLDIPSLKFKSFSPVTHSRFTNILAGEADPDEFFSRIKSSEILLHHPYQSFATSVATFVEISAKDPKVLAIKQTLYRTSGDSPIMHALIEAAKAGKQVLAVIEIRARFDETANVRWAQALEEAGAHVVYGILGLKTHAKASLVVREEQGLLRRYCHVGTGNYHPKTARLYEDFGLLSADEGLGSDLSTLFNQLSGLSPDAEYQRLLVAPKFLRRGIIERIDRETSNHLAGLPSRIRFKVNSIIDREIIRALYRAANSGVPIELNTRGICSFSNRSIAFSSRVKVKSILGRFLEHSRIYNFHNNGDEEFWIGSADMMDRNLNRRIETLVRIQDKDHKHKLDQILSQIFSEEFDCWYLDENDVWLHEFLDSSGRRLPDFQEHQIKEMVK